MRIYLKRHRYYVMTLPYLLIIVKPTILNILHLGLIILNILHLGLNQSTFGSILTSPRIVTWSHNAHWLHLNLYLSPHLDYPCRSLLNTVCTIAHLGQCTSRDTPYFILLEVPLHNHLDSSISIYVGSVEIPPHNV